MAGSNIGAEVAAEGSHEECENSSDSEVKVFLEGITKESKMSVFSKNSEDILSRGDSSDVNEVEREEDNIDTPTIIDHERGGSMLG